ncbi:MAG: glycerophosphodiester phosphodiesterase [Chloroflexota bacterium]
MTWRFGPENSLEAFAAAMRVPACDGVEFDVRLSRDGVPVILHDQDARARAGSAGPGGRAHRGGPRRLRHPAALQAVLDLLGPEPHLDVELKGDDHDEATASLLRRARGDHGERAVVSSFNPPSILAMARLLPGWTRWFGTLDMRPAVLEQAVELRCHGIATDYKFITPSSLRRAQALGLEVAAWTIRRRPTVARLDRLGVVAQCVEAKALDGEAA